MDPGGVVIAGRIAGLFGVQGEFRVLSRLEDVSHFNPGNRIMLKEHAGWFTPYTVRSVVPHKNTLRIRFEEIGDRDAAEKLVGADLYISRSALPETDADTWYWCDLIGLNVYDTQTGHIGRIRSIIETGSNDVFVVQEDGSGLETLVPNIASVVRHIDIENGRIQVDLPEGL